MPDEEIPDREPRRGPVPTSVQEWLQQLRAVTEQLGKVAARPGEALPNLPGLPGLPQLPQLALPPLPGALTSQQLEAISANVTAQREGIAAMRTQLAAFDEQLRVLEEILGPLTEWSRTWAAVEERLTTLPRLPGR